MFFDGFRWFWKGLGGFGRVWEGWGGVGRVPSPLQPPKPRQIVRCLRMLTHARSYLNPSQPSVGDPRGLDRLDRGSLRARSIGDPLGLDRLDRSGIPEGSIDSIGDPLGGIP